MLQFRTAGHIGMSGPLRLPLRIPTVWQYDAALEIEFDPAKDARNIADHGVSLEIGAVVLEAVIGEVEESRFRYGEQRMKAFGFVQGRLFACVCTMLEDGTCRIISVHGAKGKEAARWLVR